MKKVFLLLGLMGCVPQAPAVEAPTVIQIPTAPKLIIEEVKPTRHIQWTVERGYEEIEKEIVSSHEFIFKKDELVVVATLENSVLTLECSNGAKVDTHCMGTPGRFTFVCDGDATYPLVLKISCIVNPSQKDQDVEQ